MEALRTENSHQEHAEPIGEATYSPEDNKLRLYPDERLDADTYARVKAAGFSWAPKQGLFVAASWTPGRYDLLIELCGEVGDEETSLRERAEDRAARFARYKANRERDAHAYAETVRELTGDQPVGQPILIGHHSQRAAERQAEKITRAMANAVDHWGRREYWRERIPAVLAHAEHKGDEAVRQRRIKTLEAELRKWERSHKEHSDTLDQWNTPGLTREQALRVANFSPYGSRVRCGVSSATGLAWSAWDVLQEDGQRNDHCEPMTVQQVVELANEQLPRRMAHCRRWMDHYTLRLDYERAIMGAAGGDMRDRWAHMQVGGTVTTRRTNEGERLTILRVNRKGGRVTSVRTTAPRRWHWLDTYLVSVEDVTGYEEPTGGAVEKARKATAKPPLCNYPLQGAVEMDGQAWEKIHKEYKGTKVIGATETHGAHRVRWTYSGSIMHGGHPVYLTDKARKDPPAKAPEPRPEPQAIPEHLQFDDDTAAQAAGSAEVPEPKAPREPEQPTLFDAFREQLRTGVQTATSETLYPTPPDLARRMVEIARVQNGETVLEPSAGTGNIVQAVREAVDTEIVAYELNQGLCNALRNRFPGCVCQVEQADFLTVTQGQGRFPVVLMNPPFNGGQDIRHIDHALSFLAPGGRLVAICANGPRQRAAFMDRADHWEDLPDGTFKAAGTNVRTALMVIRN